MMIKVDRIVDGLTVTQYLDAEQISYAEIHRNGWETGVAAHAHVTLGSSDDTLLLAGQTWVDEIEAALLLVNQYRLAKYDEARARIVQLPILSRPPTMPMPSVPIG